MSEYVEFQGKSLDEAIEAACKHYDLKRDKLEIEIVSGGSTGIFGLVGVKKASIKARPRGSVNLNAPKGEKKNAPRADKQAPKGQTKADRDSKTEKTEAPKRADSRKSAPEAAEKPARERKKPEPRTAETPEPVETPVGDDAAAPAAENVPATRQEDLPAERVEAQTPAVKPEPKAPARRRKSPAPTRQESERSASDRQAPVHGAEDDDEPREERPMPLADVDKDALAEIVRECMMALLTPIVPDPPIEIEILDDRVNVFIDDEEHSGLIIGREGQTLSSLQYLAGRIISRRMEMNVRVQLDTGDYRERQNEKLRQQALKLAEKAAHSGRVQSTRAMSSYHRRVVHLALQDHAKVFTRSKGDGPVKRVLIIPKRRRRR